MMVPDKPGLKMDVWRWLDVLGAGKKESINLGGKKTEKRTSWQLTRHAKPSCLT